MDSVLFRSTSFALSDRLNSPISAYLPLYISLSALFHAIYFAAIHSFSMSSFRLLRLFEKSRILADIDTWRDSFTE